MAVEDATRKLGPTALAIVGLAVIVGVGSIVLAEMQPVSYDDTEVLDEVQSVTTPLPSNLTVDKASSDGFQGVEEESETIVFEDTSAGTNTTLTRDTDYNTFYSSGKFEVQNTTATEDYDSANDNLYVDYTYLSDSDATGVLGSGISSLQTFSDFFTVIVVVAIASVLFVMIRFMRRTGTSVTA